MITALSVNIPDKGKGISKILNSLRKDKICAEVNKSRGVVIKHIKYTSVRGKLNLNKIEKYIGEQRTRLLCAENIEFPSSSGYIRFYKDDFKRRLCTNMALQIVRNCENTKNLKIGVYDPDGTSSDIMMGILNYCSDVRVITDNQLVYAQELKKAMEEMGATALVTKNRKDLIDCDIIIAPTAIKENLIVKDNTPVLTIENPLYEIKGMIFYKYYFKMPNGFDKIKPQELDEEYFCSALYTLENQYELGSIVPSICSNTISSQTCKSLAEYIERQLNNNALEEKTVNE